MKPFIPLPIKRPRKIEDIIIDNTHQSIQQPQPTPIKRQNCSIYFTFDQKK